VATQTDVNVARERLNEIWRNPPARDQKFGHALRSVSVQNVRGITTTVEFQWPVTVLGGINGCGKTTILQLCSAAYTREGSGKRHFVLGRWIGPALQGETPPISPPASVHYSFWGPPADVAVPYRPESTRWGYPRRGNPSRGAVRFVGIAEFAPRIEQKDRTHQNRARLNIAATEDLDARVTESVSRILNRPYTGARIHTVTTDAAKWTADVPLLVRGDFSYTEPHMGAGEQKALRLVQQLEELSDRSLILLEEPELTLHPDAQFGLAWYLMTLARRKGHQVIVATHSPHIFEAVPREGRVLLHRDQAGVETFHQVGQLRVARELSSSSQANRDLVIVEDAVAGSFLRQILRAFAPAMLRTATLVEIGSAQDVRRVVARLRIQNVRAVGVRDPDMGENAANGLFSLPGQRRVEELLLDPRTVAAAAPHLADIERHVEMARTRGAGFAGAEAAKRAFAAIPDETGLPGDVVASDLARAWLSIEANRACAQELVQSIRRGLDEVRDE